MSDHIVVEVRRGDLVESFHRVAACAVDSNDAILYRAGNVETPVFLRSSAKPFIAAAIVRSGAAARFDLDSRELAVIAGSHCGEPFHLNAVESILDKIGMDAGALQCGVHWPYDESAAQALRDSAQCPTALHNNCSGKHAGILAMCKTIGADCATYLRVENPAQQYILEFCARVTGDDARTWPLATDGCGIPIYATGLRKAARGFARLATQRGVESVDGGALRAVRDAMMEHPAYVAGTGQLDTAIMLADEGSIVAKAGAEGVHGLGAVPQGYGYASKVLDGSARARGPSSIAALATLGVLDPAQVGKLARFARPTVYNRAGEIVGNIRAAPANSASRLS